MLTGEIEQLNSKFPDLRNRQARSTREKELNQRRTNMECYQEQKKFEWKKQVQSRGKPRIKGSTTHITEMRNIVTEMYQETIARIKRGHYKHEEPKQSVDLLHTMDQFASDSTWNENNKPKTDNKFMELNRQFSVYLEKKLGANKQLWMRRRRRKEI